MNWGSQVFSEILDDNPVIYKWVLQNLSKRVTSPGAGAEGMSAEQVIRAAFIKQMEDYSCEEPAFHLLDSACYRGFRRMGNCR